MPHLVFTRPLGEFYFGHGLGNKPPSLRSRSSKLHRFVERLQRRLKYLRELRGYHRLLLMYFHELEALNVSEIGASGGGSSF